MKPVFNVILFILFLFPCQTRASQVFGGEVTYRHLGGLKWEVAFKFYRNCTGVSVDTMHAEMVCGGGTKNLSLTRVSIKDVTPACKKSGNPCNPQNKSVSDIGIEEHLFKDTVDFDNQDSAFKKYCNIKFGFGQCCRSKGLVAGSGKNFWVYSELNKCIANDNSSPVLTAIPNNIACCNQPLNNSIGAMDSIDHDSLSYSYTEPMQDWNFSNRILYPTYLNTWITDYWPVGYNKNNGPNPNVNPPIGTFLDPERGDLTVTPSNCSELPLVTFLISEWRKDSTGQYRKIGEVRKDIQYIVQSCPANNPPTLNGPYKYDICAGQNICFTINSDDKQYTPSPPATKPPPDTVTLSWNGGFGNGSTFKIIDTTARLQKARFCWTPKESDASDLPYTFTVSARDNNCPMNGIAIKSYSVKVKKIAKTKVTIRHIQNGLYELRSEADIGFKGTPAYSWIVSDSNNHFIDLNWFYFSQYGALKSTRSLDSVQFLKEGKYIITHTINNPPLNCPTNYFDTIIVAPVIPILKPTFPVSQEKWVCKNSVDTIFPILQDARKPVRFRWNWSKTDTLPYLIVKHTKDASYRVDIYDSAGYHRFAKWYFHLYTEPILKRPRDILSCRGDTVLLGAVAYTFKDTVFWHWYFEGKPISTMQKIKVVKPGLYGLYVADSNQCIGDMDTVVVSNLGGKVNAGPDILNCKGDEFVFTANGLDTSSKLIKGSYSWYKGDASGPPFSSKNDIKFYSQKEGRMILKLTQSYGTLTCSDLDTVNYSFYKSPEILFDRTLVCQSEKELDLHTVILNPTNSNQGIVSWHLVKTLKKPGGADNNLSDLVYDKDNSGNDSYHLRIDTTIINLGTKYMDSIRLNLTYKDQFACLSLSQNPATIVIKKNLEIKFAKNELQRCYGDSVKYISNDFGVNYYGGKWFTNNDSSNYSKWPQGNIVQLSEKLGTESLGQQGGRYLLKYGLDNNNCLSSNQSVLTINSFPVIAWTQSDEGDSIILKDKSANTERREWHINSKKMGEADSFLISKSDAKVKIIILKVFNTTCETDSTIKPEIPVVSINLNKLEFYISPNPVSEKLILKTSFSQSYQVEIINNLGQSILKKSLDKREETIDVAPFPDGIYNILMKSDNDIFVQKFVKISY